MDAVLIIVSIQLVVICAIAGFAWRRFDDLKREVVLLREAVETLDVARASPRRASRQQELFATVAAANAPAPPPVNEAPPSLSDDPFSESWVRSGANAAAAKAAVREKSTPRLVPIEDKPPTHGWREPVSLRPTRDTVRGLITLLAIALPALGFAFALPAMGLMLAGVSLAIVALIASMRLDWKAPAWAGAIGAGAWALVGLETGAAAQDVLLFAIAMAVAGSAGLAQAALKRRVWSGAAMTLLTGAGLLALIANTTFIGPQGLAYGLLVAGAASVGASRLRRDGLHVAAFGATVAALLVHSGQHDAAIWFTPLAAWAGAIFLGIAAVRVPALGARGALIAATGAITPLFAAGSLALSQQGLADPSAAAGAFAGLAVLFCGVLALAARRAGSVRALKLTAWVLVASITGAAVAAAMIALPLPLASPAFAVLALLLVTADKAWPDRVWRFHATCLAAASFAVAIAATRIIGTSQDLLGPYGQSAFSLAMPAVLLGLAALIAQRRTHTTGALEAVSIALALAFTTALTRIAFANGAPALQAVSFVEAGVHVATWMGAALLLAARAEDGAGDVRRAYAFMLSVAALGACVIGALLWFTPYWTDRPETARDWALLAHAPLGFALPAVLAWAHWIYWRGERAPKRAHVALGAAGFLSAAFATFELALTRPHAPANGVDWAIVGAGMLAFALAAALHFIPGVTLRPADPRTLDLREYLKRKG